MRLGEKLVHDGVITVEQLEAALRAKVLYGGRLGSNLVEADVLSLDQLSDALGAFFGVPIATDADLAAADMALLKLIPRDLAAKHLAIPLGRAQVGRRLIVALADPRDADAIRDLEAVARMSIVPHVAPEIRIRAALETRYGIARPSRYVRMLDPRALDEPVRAPRGLPPGEGMPTIALPARVAPPDIDLPPVMLGRTPDADGLGLGVADVPPPRPRVILDADACLARLATAGHRNQVGDLLVDHLRGVFAVGIVLVVKHELAMGWKGFAPDVDDKVIEAIALPLTLDSAFRTAAEGGVVVHGAPPASGARVHLHFWRALSALPPAELVVVPILMKGRAVNLIYAHADGGGAIDGGRVRDLERLAAGVTEAYTRLIQAGKPAK